jgi:hypothetical protein
LRDAIFFRKLSVVSIRHMKDEALALTPAERRELIGYLVGLGRERIAKSLSPADRSADFWRGQISCVHESAWPMRGAMRSTRTDGR